MKIRTIRIPWILIMVSLAAGARGAAQAPPAPAYRTVAIDAAKWIRNSRLETLFGYAWPTDPNDPKSVSTALYSGSPGVILFLLELHQATGDAAYLAAARRGAEELMTQVHS